LWLHKRFEKKNFFSPLSFVAVFGSGIRESGSVIGKNQDPGSRINIPDPQLCCYVSKEFGSGSRLFVESGYGTSSSKRKILEQKLLNEFRQFIIDMPLGNELA
jgi:hypothetical protein